MLTRTRTATSVGVAMIGQVHNLYIFQTWTGSIRTNDLETVGP